MFVWYQSFELVLTYTGLENKVFVVIQQQFQMFNLSCPLYGTLLVVDASTYFSINVNFTAHEFCYDRLKYKTHSNRAATNSSYCFILQLLLKYSVNSKCVNYSGTLQNLASRWNLLYSWIKSCLTFLVFSSLCGHSTNCMYAAIFVNLHGGCSGVIYHGVPHLSQTITSQQSWTHCTIM